MTTVIPSNLAFGADMELLKLPILNLPVDTLRVRRRLRNNDFARAFVQTAAGIRHFSLRRVDGGLELDGEIGANVTMPLRFYCSVCAETFDTVEATLLHKLEAHR